MTRTMLTTQLFAAAAMLLVTVGALPAAAQTFDAAVEAYERGDYATALAGFQNYAEQGNAAAQLRSGSCTPTARACPRTTPRRCGGTASPPSRVTPPRRSTSGSCTPTARVCPRTTQRRFRLAAAQSNLGLMYANGEGVPEDDAEAVRWFRLARQAGQRHRAVRLGLMPRGRARGQGGLNIAAAQGASANEGKEHVAKYMTQSQVAKAQKLSREYWTRYVIPFQ